MAGATRPTWWWSAPARSADGPRCFAREAGVGRVVVIDRDLVGQGASSRAAGMVRAQGGSPDTVRLGTLVDRLLPIAGRALRHRLGLRRARLRDPGGDGGRRARGARAHRDAARDRPRRDVGRRRRGAPADPGDGARAAGSAAARTSRPTAGSIRRGTCARTRSRCSARRRAARAASRSPGSAPAPDAAVAGSSPASRPPPARSRPRACCSPAARRCRRSRRPPARRAWVGYARHQVVVTEAERGAARRRRTAMAFDIGAGIYWRPEEGGFLWGMSNPNEEPGPGRAIDWPYLRRMQRRLHRLVPATKGSASRRRGRRRSSTRPITCRSRDRS